MESSACGADALAAAFEQHRGRLEAVAVRMLGSRSDAEDALQEAWLRLSRQDADIDNLAGWLTTVVGRVCIDMLRARRSRGTTPYDEIPELAVVEDDGHAPEDEAVLADSVGLAMLVVLQTLTPAERLAFVLHDMFAVPFADIGQILGRSSDATKMLASRARRKVRGTDPPPDHGAPERAVVTAFSSQPHARATSTVCWPSWTPTSPCASTTRAGRACASAPRRSPPSPCAALAVRRWGGRRSSTGLPAWCSEAGTVGRSACWRAPSSTAGSWRSSRSTTALGSWPPACGIALRRVPV